MNNKSPNVIEIELRRKLRGMRTREKYPFLKVIKLSVISKMLGYTTNGILPTFGGHERFFKRINDAIKEVVESLGGSAYQRNHKYMKGNPICLKDKRITEFEEGISKIEKILRKFQVRSNIGEPDIIFDYATKGVQIQDIIEDLKKKDDKVN